MMKIENIHHPIYREIVQYIEDNDIYYYCEIVDIALDSGNDRWGRILLGEKGSRFFSDYCFYKMKDRERREKRKKKANKE